VDYFLGHLENSIAYIVLRSAVFYRLISVGIQAYLNDRLYVFDDLDSTFV